MIAEYQFPKKESSRKVKARPSDDVFTASLHSPASAKVEDHIKFNIISMKTRLGTVL